MSMIRVKSIHGGHEIAVLVNSITHFFHYGLSYCRICLVSGEHPDVSDKYEDLGQRIERTKHVCQQTSGTQ